MPWRGEWLPTIVFLPEKSHGWRSLAGYSPWGCRESDRTEKLTLWLPLSSPSHQEACTSRLLSSIRGQRIFNPHKNTFFFSLEEKISPWLFFHLLHFQKPPNPWNISTNVWIFHTIERLWYLVNWFHLVSESYGLQSGFLSTCLFIQVNNPALNPNRRQLTTCYVWSLFICIFAKDIDLSMPWPSLILHFIMTLVII